MNKIWILKKERKNNPISLGILFSFGVILMCVSICSSEETVMQGHGNLESRQIKEVSPQLLNTLGRKRIFFGHQSVGNNIIHGIKDILAEHQKINLKIVRTKNKSDFENPIFGHYEIGKNDYPLTKIEDFAHILDDGIGNKVNIAMMKFCFVDITSRTDIENVFTTYKESMKKLKARFPGMTIVHFTVPLLREEKQGVAQKAKTFLKKLMGKKKESFFSNINNVARNTYNKLLVNYYKGKEPVFDLARFESTDSTGQRERFVYDGHEYYALVPEYTEDGGHLNEKGRKYIAEQLLVFLANF